jgi:phosphomannomutase
MAIFKAYDVRGTVPDQLNPELARKIGIAFANMITAEVREARGAAAPERIRIGVGRDARPSGDTLVPAFQDGLNAAGADVVDFGLTTTPMLYYGVGALGLDAGAVATASHNPPQYNGFKFTREQAIPVAYTTGISDMEKAVADGNLPTAASAGSVSSHELFDQYREWVLGFAKNADSKRLKVAIDAGNGMGGLYDRIVNRLNIDVEPLYFDVDCTFPNHEANPLKVETLEKLIDVIRRKGCDVGFAFDGDADRCVAVTETGEVVRSDFMTALLSLEMLERNPGAAVLYDLRSSRIVPETISKHGGRPIRVRVGHSFAKAVMRQEQAVFGGELSGHCYYRDAYQSDSGLITLIEVLNVLRHHNKPLSDLVAPFKSYDSTGEVNFRVDDKDRILAELESTFGPGGEGGKVDKLDGVSVDFDDWWFNVRPSNTEPLLRLTMECTQPDMLDAKFAQLKGILGEPVTD